MPAPTSANIARQAEPTILPASISDAPAIAEVLDDARARIAAKKISQWENPFPASFIGNGIARGEFYVAKIATRVAGTFRFLLSDPAIWGEDDATAAYVHTLAIHRDFAGRNLGTRLLSWCENEALNQSRSFLRLDCAAENTALRAYYLRHGFLFVTEKPTAGFHLALYEKPLHRTQTS